MAKKTPNPRAVPLVPAKKAIIPLPPPGQGASKEKFKSGASPPPSGGAFGAKPKSSTGAGKLIRETAGKALRAGAAGAGNIALDGVKGTGRYISQKASQKIHQKVSEAERDNAAIETAHEAERIGEKLARAGLRKGTKLVRDKLRNVGKKEAPANLGTARHTANAPKPIVPEAARLPGASRPKPPALPAPGAAAKAPRASPSASGAVSNTLPVPTQKSGTAISLADLPQPPMPHAPAGDSSGKFRHGSAPNAAPPPPSSRLRHDSPGGGSTLRDLWNMPVERFGTHIDFSDPKPGLIGKTLHAGRDAGLGALKMGADRAALQLRGKIDQSADDNSAFKAAHQAEQLAERPVGYALKKGGNAVAAPVKRMSNHVRSKLRHRFLIGKQRYLRKHQSIAQARGAMMKAKALTREIIRNAKPLLVGLGVCVFIYFLCSMIVGPIAAALSKAGTEYIATTTYPVANQDITDSTVQWTELKTALEQRIENIETEFPDFDEYRYDVEEIGQYPFELISYLAAMHLEFTHPAVQAEIEEIFNLVNALELTEETETRYDADGNPYEWKILNIALHPKPFEDVIAPRLEAADAEDLYEVYMGSGGNQQAFGNPFTFNWSAYVTSHYGNRKNPTGEGYEFHTGLDIGVAAGTPIRSLQDGVVVVSGWHDLYGNYMVIRNEDNISTLYAHCSALHGSVGDTVRQGQLIAAVGSTGNSSGPHLHVEVKLGDERVDPIFYIQSYNDA